MFLIYKFLTIVFYPIILFVIYLRKFLKKEDSFRFKEKLFSQYFNVINKEDNYLIWFHGASIGEITSIFPVIDKLKKETKKIKFLITSTTYSSGKMVEKKFENDTKIIHRYFPVDVPHLTKNFIKLWKPNLVCFIDSEIWPNFLNEIKRKNIPLFLVNGRITKRSFNRWNFFQKLAKKVFNNFDVSITSNLETSHYLKRFDVKNIKYFGNLKFIPSKKISSELEKNYKEYFDKRKVWCAASTHEDEEIFCVKTHLEIKKIYDNLLTIIIPRHIHRVNIIAKNLKKFNVNVQILNEGDKIEENIEVLLVNSFGHLSKYYNYCKSVFIGKSILSELDAVGGQNPIEAAIHGCKVYHGPYVYNFKEVYEFLGKINISEEIKNIDEISSKIKEDLKRPKVVNIDNIQKLNSHGEKILLETIKEFKKIIN